MNPKRSRLYAAFATAAIALSSSLPAFAAANENANSRPQPAAAPAADPAPAASPAPQAGPAPFVADILWVSPPSPTPQDSIFKKPATTASADDEKVCKAPENKEPRVVKLAGEIDNELADQVIKELQDLDKKDPGKPIEMRITSPGGGVVSGLRIYDAMKALKSPVATVCDGACMSMAAVLLAGGSPGMRSATPHAVVMIHELSGGTEGKFSDMAARQKYSAMLEDMLVTILSDSSGQPKEKLADMMRTDTFLSAQDAQKMGLIDKVQKPVQPEVKKAPVLRIQQPVRRWGPAVAAPAPGKPS